jgi:hypothetical protein
VTGGGYDINSNGAGIAAEASVIYNGPVEESGPEGPPGPVGAWQVVVQNGTSGNPVIAIAICSA